MEAALDTIAVMCLQESQGYATMDVFRQKHLTIPIALDVDDGCRKKMAAWMYQVVDFCKFNRESAEIALSFFDRFLLTSSGVRALQDRSVFQLAAMTALYTAVKIHEPEAMDPSLVSSLSRGVYSPQDIEQMEYILLHSLNWRVNPPTTLSFVREFFHFIPVEAMNVKTREMVYDITKFQVELAVTENAFVGVKPSITAYCSFMNALNCLDMDVKIVQFINRMFQEALCISNVESDQVMHVQSYLVSVVVEHPLAARASEKMPTSPKAGCHRRSISGVSPRTIAL